jgi:hypothetical protein
MFTQQGLVAGGQNDRLDTIVKMLGLQVLPVMNTGSEQQRVSRKIQFAVNNRVGVGPVVAKVDDEHKAAAESVSERLCPVLACIFITTETLTIRGFLRWCPAYIMKREESKRGRRMDGKCFDRSRPTPATEQGWYNVHSAAYCPGPLLLEPKQGQRGQQT